MDTDAIEFAIEKYVQERKELGKQKASEHFIALVYLKHGRTEIAEFLKKVVGLSRYYIDFLKVIQNPFKGPEMALLASMVAVGIYSCYLTAEEHTRVLGITVISGTLLHICLLVGAMARKWSETGVMIAIYREIVEIAEHEVAEAAG
jgi:hypothetical protein